MTHSDGDAIKVLKGVADMHRAYIVHGSLRASDCLWSRKKGDLVVKLLLLDKIAMAETIMTRGGGSSADPSSTRHVTAQQLERDPKFAADAVSCGLIALRIFASTLPTRVCSRLHMFLFFRQRTASVG